jgi:signal transduction histidine kinase
MNSQREVVATDTVDYASSPLGADLHDQIIQQLFAIGLAMQSTQRKETSPEQAMRIGEHIDQLHDVLERLRRTDH